MPKYTKHDYKRALNSILNINVSWDRMKLEDLKIIYNILSDPANIGKRIIAKEARERITKRAFEFVDGVLGEE